MVLFCSWVSGMDVFLWDSLYGASRSQRMMFLQGFEAKLILPVVEHNEEE